MEQAYMCARERLQVCYLQRERLQVCYLQREPLDSHLDRLWLEARALYLPSTQEIMDKLITANLKLLFEEMPQDQDVLSISNRFTNLNLKEFTSLLMYLLRIVNPEGVEKLLKISKLSSKSELHRYRTNVCSVLSQISEMYPDAPPLPNILPSHLIHPVGDNIAHLLWKLSMIALIVSLHKNHGVEVEKYPSKDSSESVKGHLARLAADNKAAVSEQKKRVLVDKAQEENRDLQASVEGIKKQINTLKELINTTVAALDLDDDVKCRLADVSTKLSYADVEASLQKRFEDADAVLATLESHKELVEKCRMLAESCESQQLSSIYACGDALRRDFPFLETLPEEDFTLENVLGKFVERLEDVLEEFAQFSAVCDEHHVKEKLEGVSAELVVLADKTATCKAELERISSEYRDMYCAAMIPLLEKQKEATEPDPFYELCREVSELVCMPPMDLKLEMPVVQQEDKAKQLPHQVERADVPVVGPSYVDFLDMGATVAAEQDTASLPSCSRDWDLGDAPPFSTIKKPHKGLGGRPCRDAGPEGSPADDSNSFLERLRKDAEGVAAAVDAAALDAADFSDVYTTTPTRLSDVLQPTTSSEIDQSWSYYNLSDSSKDSD